MMTFDIPSLLERLDYPITIRGENCVCSTIYRNGDNSHGLFVNSSGFCYDQVQNRTFPLVEFVATVLGSSIKEAQAFIGSAQTAEPREKEPKLDIEAKFDPSVIGTLTPSYKYYLEKGISKETLEDFRGGLCHGGKMYLRFVFLIYNKQNKLLGAAGRCVRYTKEQEKEFGKNRPRPKWKNLGEKKLFNYPLFISSPHIQSSRRVILVESIGDALSLWNSGIKNIFCLFGTSLSDAALIALTAENPREIILGLNNDYEAAVNRGVVGAAKVRAKLAKFFSNNMIRDGFPFKNDFGDQTPEENRKWMESL